MQASGSCPQRQLKHTFIPNASAKQETAASKLKHELLYYLSTNSITISNRSGVTGLDFAVTYRLQLQYKAYLQASTTAFLPIMIFASNYLRRYILNGISPHWIGKNMQCNIYTVSNHASKPPVWRTRTITDNNFRRSRVRDIILSTLCQKANAPRSEPLTREWPMDLMQLAHCSQPTT